MPYGAKQTGGSIARAARRGFTLIELMASLALAGLSVVTVALLVTQLDVTRHVIERASSHADASANGARLLREIVERAEVGVDSTRQFAGDPQSFVMPTWCDVPGGWLERCMVRVALDHRGDSTAVDAQFDNNVQLELVALPGSVALVYLGTGLGRVAWVSSWGRGIVPPIAVGFVRQGGDTSIVRVGDRG